MPCGNPAHDPPDHDDHPGCTQPREQDDCTDRGGLPPDPFPARMTEMIQSMTALFDLYQGALDAGFSEERAFQLTTAFLFHALDQGGDH